MLLSSIIDIFCLFSLIKVHKVICSEYDLFKVIVICSYFETYGEITDLYMPKVTTPTFPFLTNPDMFINFHIYMNLCIIMCHML